MGFDDSTPIRFNGSLMALQVIVDRLDVPCRWQHKGAFEMAVFDDGVSNLKLNWWPETGELRLVGDPEVRDDIHNRLVGFLDEHESSLT
tara:strand:- start:2 stop:268 length:267 start_codon:yes stop_codon:yes gene_type:complete